MYNKIKKTILSAAICALSLAATSPAYGEELVGTNVIVVDETEDVSPVSESDGPALNTEAVNQSPDSEKEEDAPEASADTKKPDSKEDTQAGTAKKDTQAQSDNSDKTDKVNQSEDKSKSTDTQSSAPDGDYVNAGPGAVKKEEKAPEPKEISLGTFTITGYCGCEICSSGHGLTYSGTVAMPNHTLSADLSKFPLGTKLRINGIVYTVEDMGSAVNGDILDIFYTTHEEALAKGTYKAEVFSVKE